MSLVSLVVIKLSLIALFGFYLYKKSLVGDRTLTVLTTLVVSYTVPFLIFSRLVRNSQIVALNSIWIFLLVAAAIFIIGYLLGFIAAFISKSKTPKEFISLTSFQNGGYLPMSIAFFLFPSGIREKFLVYIFLYLLGFNILMWSFGSFLIFRKKGEKFRFKSIFTPPIISTLLALLFIYTRTVNFIPRIILEPIAMIGDTSFVLSLLILGCWLAKIKLKGFSLSLPLIIKASFIKLMVMPFLFIVSLAYFKAFSLLGLFIVLESAMPSAVSLPIIAGLRKADSEFVSQGVFFSHLLGIITIPVWLGVAQALGFSFS